jgi:hypothetical protein
MTSAQLAAIISDETGSGALVFGTSPTIAAPAINGTVTTTGLTLPALTLSGNITSSGNPSLNIGTGALTAGAGSFTTLSASATTGVALLVTRTENDANARTMVTLSRGNGSGTSLTLNTSGDAANGIATAYLQMGATPMFRLNGTTEVESIVGFKTTTLSTTGSVTLGDATGDTVSIHAGTAALPTLIPAGDPNTGLWFPAADTIAASTNGVERLRIDSAGNVTASTPTAAIGYGTGAGGTVTQGSGSGKATAVTLSKSTGTITLDGAALNAATTVSFTLTNTVLAATDILVVQHVSAGTAGAYNIAAFPSAGSAVISVRNVTAGNLSEAIVLRFTIVRSVNA